MKRFLASAPSRCCSGFHLRRLDEVSREEGGPRGSPAGTALLHLPAQGAQGRSGAGVPLGEAVEGAVEDDPGAVEADPGDEPGPGLLAGFDAVQLLEHVGQAERGALGEGYVGHRDQAALVDEHDVLERSARFGDPHPPRQQGGSLGEVPVAVRGVAHLPVDLLLQPDRGSRPGPRRGRLPGLSRAAPSRCCRRGLRKRVGDRRAAAAGTGRPRRRTCRWCWCPSRRGSTTRGSRACISRTARHTASDRAQSGAPASTSACSLTASRSASATRPQRTARPPPMRCIEAHERPIR